jgi:hypothetical protein
MGLVKYLLILCLIFMIWSGIERIDRKEPGFLATDIRG